MRGYDGRPGRGGFGEDPAAGDRSGGLVDVEGAGVVGAAHLYRVVGQIADEDRRPARVEPQHRGAGGVPRRGA